MPLKFNENTTKRQQSFISLIFKTLFHLSNKTKKAKVRTGQQSLKNIHQESATLLVCTCAVDGSLAHTAVHVILVGSRVQERTRSTKNKLLRKNCKRLDSPGKKQKQQLLSGTRVWPSHILRCWLNQGSRGNRSVIVLFTCVGLYFAGHCRQV